ncbi:MAG: EamA family transporter [Planctomycetia bacterium]|nr:EamA family transporter [Planctomycetia bacterium]
MWKLFAVLSALFAALTAILAKVGIQGIDSNLATAIRCVVIIIFVWGIVFWNGAVGQIPALSMKNWTFLILSGFATGLSWIFYFRALQLGDASKVSAVDKLSVAFAIILAILILREPADPKVLAGGALIVLGSLIIIW